MLTSMHKWRTLRAGLLAATVAGGAGGAAWAAGEYRDGRGGVHGWAGPHRMAALCEGRALERIEDVAAWVDLRLDLNAGQQASLEALRDEAAAAAESMQALCERPQPGDHAAMLDYGERALELSLAGLRRIRPQLETFLASLDPGQRAQVDHWFAQRRHRRG